MARIYCAGGEAIELLRALIDNECTSVMLSFYYLQQRGALPQVLRILKEHPEVRVFLDSGSRSFIKKDRGDPQTYWKAYHDVLKQHGHRFEYASEFDADDYAWKSKGAMRRVTDEQLDVWRDDLVELGTVPIVPVWHDDRGMSALDALLADARYPHVGFSYDAEFSRGEVAKLIGKAHAWNKTVHGYAESSLDNLRWLKFDTVSSTKWLCGQKYGDALIFEGGHVRRIYATAKRGKAERKKFRAYFTRIGVDADKIEQDDRKELNKANILAMVNLSRRLELVHPHKGPQRHTGAPESTQQPKPAPTALITGPDAVTPVAGTSVGVSGTAQETRIIPLQPVEMVSVEKTEEQAIQLQEIKPFMPVGAPALHCSGCSLATECPKFREGAVCAYREEFAKVTARDANEVVEQLASIFALNIERGRYLRLAEQISGGGVISPEVTKHMTDTFVMGAKLAELMKGKKKTTASMQGSGVVSRLFGSIGAQPPRELTDGGDEHEIPDLTENEIEEPEDDGLTDRQRKQQTRANAQ